MPQTHLDDLRAIITQAAARDADLQHALEALATDTLKELGWGDAPLVWAEIKAANKERQVTPSFVMEDGWLRGDLQFAVTADQTFVVSLVIREAAHEQHEAGAQRERSRTMIVDPPDPTQRADARKKFAEHVSGDLENQVRGRVALPRV
jgi:hypothetical protein